MRGFLFDVISVTQRLTSWHNVIILSVGIGGQLAERSGLGKTASQQKRQRGLLLALDLLSPLRHKHKQKRFCYQGQFKLVLSLGVEWWGKGMILGGGSQSL